MAISAAKEIIAVAKDAYNNYKGLKTKPELEHQKNNIFKNIHNINDEILELEAQKTTDGFLNQYDQNKLQNLYKLRSTYKDLLQDTKEVSVFQELHSGGGHYDVMNISDENLHVLQFHSGQTVYRKKCNNCGRQMVLQWDMKKITKISGYGGFFWGCTGFMGDSNGICKNTQPFLPSDLNLFTNVDRPEFDLTHDQLEKIVSYPANQNAVVKRMDPLKHLPNEIYLCPVHNEPMLLKQKNNPTGLLDMYFYSCPRWEPLDRGCNQIVKLKSAAQLSSALESFYQKGLL